MHYPLQIHPQHGILYRKKEYALINLISMKYHKLIPYLLKLTNIIRF